MEHHNSGIGGQAVLEGIMMRNQEKYSIAARKENGEIELTVKPYKTTIPIKGIEKIPILRGVSSFIDSLVVGISSLMWSADVVAQEEEEEKKVKTEKEQAKEDRIWKFVMTVTVMISICFSVVLFMLLPFWLAGLLRRTGLSDVWVNLLEAVLRIVIFLGYMLVISNMKDIQKVYAYHGAEHKCINCIENGMELTPQNVLKCSRQHKRCGTSFMLIVICISVVFFLILGLFGIKSRLWRLLWRLILIPVIAGVSYEILRFAAVSENRCVAVMTKPGLALQKLVTREPDEKEAEVAIAAIEAVFDWRTWQKEHFGDAAAEAEKNV
ncbi:MAG: DUF1385 domain-containing protein [Lachnospiraceae bacterium]|nr:DUF1385 domain-containing protein [Lachnospiraceae bacterium]